MIADCGLQIADCGLRTADCRLQIAWSRSRIHNRDSEVEESTGFWQLPSRL